MERPEKVGRRSWRRRSCAAWKCLDTLTVSTSASTMHTGSTAATSAKTARGHLLRGAAPSRSLTPARVPRRLSGTSTTNHRPCASGGMDCLLIGSTALRETLILKPPSRSEFLRHSTSRSMSKIPAGVLPVSGMRQWLVVLWGMTNMRRLSTSLRPPGTSTRTCIWPASVVPSSTWKAWSQAPCVRRNSPGTSTSVPISTSGSS
mmetsp:Transcript_55737/g.178860  ORF Transcript_55737/g.178860 Transcript_55737/m.178860 type:complete len:204 (+) Transcript_55737:725-1336(+)